MVRALIMAALRALKSLKTSSTVRGLYCPPPSIYHPLRSPCWWTLWRERETLLYRERELAAGGKEEKII